MKLRNLKLDAHRKTYMLATIANTGYATKSKT